MWYALYIAPGKELKTCNELKAQRFTAFCPYKDVKRRVKRPRLKQWVQKTFQEPLFSRYVFVEDCAFDRVRQVPGVIDLVRCAGRPLVIPEAVMDAIKKRADAKGFVGAEDKASAAALFKGKVGDKFRFAERSPFSGLVARIAGLEGLAQDGEVRAWVEMFGKDHEVTVPVESIGLITPAKGIVAAACA